MPILKFIDLRVKGSTTFFGGIENKETCERYGVIKWSHNHKQYIYTPFGKSYFTAAILKEIVDFLNELNEKQKPNGGA